MRRLTAIGVALVVLVATASTARAQQEGRDGASGTDEERAREHYDAGLRAYNVGDFEVAIEEWKQAYRLHGSARFLFNIGQAYRGDRDYAQAIFFYNAYLRENPEASNREEVLRLRDEMRRLLEEERASRDKPPTEPMKPGDEDAAANATEGETARAEEAPTEASPTPVVAPDDGPAGGAVSGTPGDEDRSGGVRLRRAGLITGAAGVGLVATGIAFGLSAASTESDLEQAARRGDPWTPELEDRQDSGERAALLSTGFWVTGVAAVATGGVLYYLGWREGDAAEPGDGPVVQVAPVFGTSTGITMRVEY